ncbi:pyrroloquinoline-quinone synthase PqqC [Veronia pacifica]|uniref:Pyrroloquinoline-quinone synthase n=1 Tax=Veronia pacifica TaxID=1080227 RepID=A0A1C3E7Z8_9GAMM|nr:pyrroloquinoline-quinone synthase PqqC [Veronia pacifica]ODA29362.1 pyrroloquinoline quinone biosynthesis protein PqqC [Veronia pacifica]
MTAAMDRDTFRQALLDKGRYYHIHHPFHKAMYQGQCSRRQIRAWIANRFYYQTSIPIKDAAILANCRDPSIRREWVQRILDHDGHASLEVKWGGIEAWLRLAEAAGLEREEVLDERWVLPGVRFAVDAYVNFARRASWQEAACSSLTELFAPEIHQSRLSSWPQHYPWIEQKGLTYFQQRLGQARRDVEQGLAITLDHFTTAEQQRQALNILQFKLDILWSLLDAISMAYEFERPPYAGLDEQAHPWHRGLDH